MADTRSLNSALKRNIEALRRRRREEEENASVQQRLASAITRFTGSMGFVYTMSPPTASGSPPISGWFRASTRGIRLSWFSP
jgi:hypothetical protein